VYSTWSETA